MTRWVLAELWEGERHYQAEEGSRMLEYRSSKGTSWLSNTLYMHARSHAEDKLAGEPSASPRP